MNTPFLLSNDLESYSTIYSIQAALFFHFYSSIPAFLCKFAANNKRKRYGKV